MGNRAPSVIINVGDFLVPTGLGTYIPYGATTTLSGTSTGTFVLGETVTQATSAATGIVVVVGTTGIAVKSVTGTFDTTHVVTGGTSTATLTPTLVTTDNKIFGVSDEAVASTDSNFATANQYIGISTPVKILDFLKIPVSSGTATQAMEGTYVNVDPANPGSVIVGTVGTQIYIYKFIDSKTIIGAVSLTV